MSRTDQTTPEELVEAARLLQKTNKQTLSASYDVALVIAQAEKSYSDVEFIKKCMLEVVKCVYPEKTQLFDSLSLSGSTVMRRVKDMSDNVRKQLQTIAEKFEYFTIALDERCDVGDTS